VLACPVATVVEHKITQVCYRTPFHSAERKWLSQNKRCSVNLQQIFANPCNRRFRQTFLCHSNTAWRWTDGRTQLKFHTRQAVTCKFRLCHLWQQRTRSECCDNRQCHCRCDNRQCHCRCLELQNLSSSRSTDFWPCGLTDCVTKRVPFSNYQTNKQ